MELTSPPPVLKAAMVKRSADLVGVDMSGGFALQWDAEVYDPLGLHDTVTTNSRITVPAGVNFVEVGCTTTFGSLAVGTDLTVVIRKNGSTSYDGTVQIQHDATTASPVNLHSGPIPVVPGDYFEVFVFTTGDTSVDLISARSSFWLKVVG